MTEERPPGAQPERFERLCAELDDYDALPTLSPPPERGAHHDEEGRSERLDDHILAVLVSPY
jgi:hypothetical protein